MSRTSLLQVIGLSLLLLTTTSAAEPELAAGAPEAVAERALQALKERRIDDFAAMMHPDALRQLHSTLMSVIEAAEAAGRAHEVLPLFGGRHGVADLRQMDPAEFFAAFMQAMIRLRPQIADALQGMTIETIGHVREADVAHVVYRGTVRQNGLESRQIAVMSLKAHDDGWGMLLTGDVEGLATALKRQYGAE